jgi:hypothetical protein
MYPQFVECAQRYLKRRRLHVFRHLAGSFTG